MKRTSKFLFTLMFAFTFSFSDAQEIKKWKLDDMKEMIASTDKPTILNFWASFCKPCLEEMPYFQELAKKYEEKGVQLILVNLDSRDWYPNKLQALAKKRKITAPIVFLDETDADLFCPAVDPSWSGAIPASIFINNKTGYKKFFEDQLSREELEKQISLMLAEVATPGK
jgi:thiol-disulfide isomerase/thioredoxin